MSSPAKLYRIQYLTLTEKKIFSPSLINDFRFGFTRFKNLDVNFDNFDPSLHYLPDRKYLGSLQVTGLTTIGSTSAREGSSFSPIMMRAT